MKFIALLLATVSAAEVADRGDCSAADATCVAASCCGTAKDLDGVADGDKVATLITFFATVCSTKPAADDKPADVEIKEKVAVCDQACVDAAAALTPPVVKAVVTAEVAAVKGTFTCNAAADASAASYMTVGAAAIIAAATLLQ